MSFSHQDKKRSQRGMILVVVCLFPILPFVLGSYAWGESLQELRFSVFAPKLCHQYGQEEQCSKSTLRDSFEAGLKVVLVGARDTCRAKIADTCTYCDEVLHKGSQLLVDKQCQEGVHRVAVIGVDLKAVHLVPAREDKSPLPKDVELQARRLLLKSLENLYSSLSNHILSSHTVAQVIGDPPKMLRAGNAIILLFKYELLQYKSPEPRYAPVLVVNSYIDPLPSTQEHLFFAVNRKLHLTCIDAHPLAARPWRRVYDLSSGTPRVVYPEQAALTEKRAKK